MKPLHRARSRWLDGVLNGQRADGIATHSHIHQRLALPREFVRAFAHGIRNSDFTLVHEAGTADDDGACRQPWQTMPEPGRAWKSVTI